MKRPMSAAGVALALVLAGALGGPAAAEQKPLPFSGSLAGFTDASDFPVAVTYATGNANQLGQFSFTMPHVVYLPPYASGTFTFLGANGDSLAGTMTGVAGPTEAPNVLLIVESLSITTGTGRFAGATGSVTLQRLYDRGSFVTHGSFSGTINMPCPGK